MSLLNATLEVVETVQRTLHFTWLDHSVFAFMLVMSTVVGVLIGVCGKQDTKVDYLLGGKKMGILPISMSLIFSHLSGITLMAMPTEMYTYGTMFFMVNVSSLFVSIINGYVFLPVFFKLQLTSTYEYLELRFNQKVRLMASFLFTVSLFLYLPIVVYVPALAFNHVSGISVHFVTTTVVSVCVLYTMLGGIKAVVWTDFLQSFVTVGSTLAIIILGLIKIGGFKNMWETSSAGGRIEFFNTDPSPFARNTIWTIAVGTTFGWLSSLGVSQGMVQKFIALPDLRSARLALMFFSVGLLFMKMFSACVGLIIYTAYHDCDPIITKQISKADQLLPYFTMDTASKIPGLPGLFVAGIFSAGLSTMSSYLNCLSATIYEDFISPLIKGNKKLESKAPFFMKSIVVIVGVVCLCMVFIVERLGGILQVAIATSGVTSGATLGIFFIGMFFPWANSKIWYEYRNNRYIVLSSTAEDGEIEVRVSVGPTPLPEGMGDDAFIVYKISIHYYCMIGTIITITLGMVVSYFTGFQNPKEVDSRLLVPFMQKYGSSYQEAPTEPLEKELMDMTPPPQYERVRRTSMAA
uniref:(California timema) hypothetical protein n=1 Tax=Timema californicum TaxID=61474 RepID=A0A7R9J0K3_TIMCA|nr:unnamed protein product [Timema californicum]